MKNRIKKTGIIILCLSIGLILHSACKDTSATIRTNTGKNDVAEILAKETQSTEPQSTEPESPRPSETSEAEKPVEGQDADVDVDLTKMSSNMVYAEVYNMLVDPDSYRGKSIKMKGLYTLLLDEVTGNTYYGCIVKDATACCASGIEFVPKENYNYPKDFPNEGEDITVIGIFDTYLDGEDLYCTLREADFWKE
ncbi:MAG: hypothetical protein IKO32_07015 [Lachnospiraceae bacterium]|nr:hypothetical protein [Lachnospiraceae bacterium]